MPVEYYGSGVTDDAMQSTDFQDPGVGSDSTAWSNFGDLLAAAGSNLAVAGVTAIDRSVGYTQQGPYPYVYGADGVARIPPPPASGSSSGLLLIVLLIVAWKVI